MFATSLQRAAYRRVAKPLFFRQDPELVHDAIVRVGAFLGSFAPARAAAAFAYRYRDRVLAQDILGMRFPNPVGLAAGFDKNGEMTRLMSAVGFGFQEVGSATGEPCEGNPKPRLWRLPKSEALVVWYGLKNDGAGAIAGRLAAHPSDIPLGTSVAKTNCAATADTERGILDYEKAFRALADVGDYTTVNVSCPNAFGGQPFTTPDRLDSLLARLDGVPTDKPVFVKFGADLSPTELDALIAVLDRHRVHGIILTNLTKKRDGLDVSPDEPSVPENGGISGKAVARLSENLLAHAARTCEGRYVLVAVGGIFTAEDAYRRIRLGASLVQLITGMIYEGPQLIGEINRGLAALLRRDGFANVADAVGADLR